MSLKKNISGQKLAVYAHDTVADAPKTGDAANITAQLSKDFGASAAVGDTNPTELDATNQKGLYVFDLTQAETNADVLALSAVSTTAGVKLDPVQVFTDDLHKYGIKAMGTAQSASATGVVLAAAEAFADDVLIGNVIAVYGSTQGYWQERIITDNALTGDAVTVPTWTVTPTGTITYVIYGSAPGMAAADISDAVRTELTTELARIDVAVSTRATPAQVATELATYDAPTKAEMDAGFAAVPGAVLVAADGNPIASNVEEVNAVAIQGAGVTGNEWRPV